MAETACIFILSYLRCLAFISVIRPLPQLLGKGVLLIVAGAISLPIFFHLLNDQEGVLSNISLLKFLILAGQYIIFGIIYGLPFALFFEALMISGKVIDFSRGAQFAEQLLPQLGRKVSQVENIFLLLSGLFCFSLGGYQIILHVLFLSFKIKSIFLFDPATLALTFNGLFAKSLSVALIFSAPIILVCLLIDLSGGVLLRMIGRLNIHYELASIKMFLGLFIFIWIITNKADPFKILLSECKDVAKTLIPISL